MATVVKVAPDIRTWIDDAAEEITRVLEVAVSAKGTACAALSGGRTPVAVYQRLAQTPWRERMPWDRTHWFWVDERWVPPDHPDSNYGVAHQVLFSKVPVNPAQVHGIPTAGLKPDEAAAAYEAQLREILPQGAALDLAVLGMGSDGHTASLFPGISELAETTRWVAATLSPAGVRQRISMTFPLLNATDTVLFLVTGADKRHLIEAVLGSERKATDYPAGKIKAAWQTIWLLDQEAAGDMHTPA